ncbi:hypothetical protein MUK42_28620, partial [Musa troglodytarum]
LDLSASVSWNPPLVSSRFIPPTLFLNPSTAFCTGRRSIDSAHFLNVDLSGCTLEDGFLGSDMEQRTGWRPELPSMELPYCLGKLLQERRIRPEVIPANEIGVTFDDIGALDEIKESLQELIMFPLQRPDLFKGGLLKPCKEYYSLGRNWENNACQGINK